MSQAHEAKHRLIEQFGLAPHPEGGYYRETHRDSARVLRVAPSDAADGATSGANTAPTVRAASTCIYYMLCDGAYSAWHRIRSDELWHFYAGDPLEVHVIDAAGALRTHRLGNALSHDEAAFQVVVPAGCWFAAERPTLADAAQAAGFSFVGCTVAPGFEFSEFELGEADALANQYPGYEALIRRLSRHTPA